MILSILNFCWCAHQPPLCMSTHNVKTNKKHALAPVLITNCVAITTSKTLTYMWMLGKEFKRFCYGKKSSSPLDSVDSPNLLTQGFFVSLQVLVSKLHCHRHHGMASDSKNQIRNTTICVEWSISSLRIIGLQCIKSEITITAPVLQTVVTGFLLLWGSLTSGSKHQSVHRCPHEEDLQHSPTLATKMSSH